MTVPVRCGKMLLAKVIQCSRKLISMTTLVRCEVLEKGVEKLNVQFILLYGVLQHLQITNDI